MNAGFVRVLDDQVGGSVLVARRTHRLGRDGARRRGAPHLNRGGAEVLDFALNDEGQDGGLEGIDLGLQGLQATAW
ncbi:hypothetical protein MASR2M78_09670 [Treponema sp.]